MGSFCVTIKKPHEEFLYIKQILDLLAEEEREIETSLPKGN